MYGSERASMANERCITFSSRSDTGGRIEVLNSSRVKVKYLFFLNYPEHGNLITSIIKPGHGLETPPTIHKNWRKNVT